MSKANPLLTERLATLATAFGGDTIRRDPLRTLEPQRRESARPALDALTRLARPTIERGLAVEVEEALAAGGMGVIHTGTQLSLGRKVAVKTLRPEHRTPENTLRLLTEGWITGALEHPNVVPIHDVTLDADGSPVIVMKRIEGVSWEEIMADPPRRTVDALEWNLGVLRTVCTTAHFAHSRGIIHRDLKPANVMLGAFGEVYVLDWGIAVSLRDDGSGRIPLAADVDELAGTPSYMAPEMFDSDGSRLSPRTDVYLLGAILYQILAGAPPHHGATLEAVLASVLEPPPPPPAGTPDELWRICQRALDPDPDARFETPEQLRLAIEGYLERRGAARLVATADALLARLRAELAAGGEGAERRLALYSRFSECRFAYREALVAWRGNAQARAGQLAAVAAMVEYELANGDPRAAAAVLADVEDAPAGLRERIVAVVAQQDKEDARLRKMARDLDPRVGQGPRRMVMTFMTSLWVILPAMATFASDAWQTHTAVLVFPLTFFIVLVWLMIATRDSMMQTVFNKRIAATAILMNLSMFTAHAIGALRGFDVPTIQVLHLYTWFVLAAMLTITVERRFVFMAVGYLVAVIAAAAWPRALFPIMAGANLILAINLHVVWNSACAFVPDAPSARRAII